MYPDKKCYKKYNSKSFHVNAPVHSAIRVLRYHTNHSDDPHSTKDDKNDDNCNYYTPSWYLNYFPYTTLPYICIGNGAVIL